MCYDLPFHKEPDSMNLNRILHKSLLKKKWSASAIEFVNSPQCSLNPPSPSSSASSPSSSSSFSSPTPPPPLLLLLLLLPFLRRYPGTCFQLHSTAQISVLECWGRSLFSFACDIINSNLKKKNSQVQYLGHCSYISLYRPVSKQRYYTASFNRQLNIDFHASLGISLFLPLTHISSMKCCLLTFFILSVVFTLAICSYICSSIQKIIYTRKPFSKISLTAL